jgi:membrane protease YdiL (CAAX protease family)
MTVPVFTLLLLSLAIAANFILRFAWGRFVLAATPFATAGALALLAVHSAAGAPTGAVPYLAASILGALIVAAIGLHGIRARLARFLPITPDNPLHTASMAIALALILAHFSGYLLQGAAPSSTAPVTLSDQVLNLVLMLGLALFGIGALTRRSPRDLWRRLGLVRPTRFQMLFAFGLGSFFQLVGLAAYGLSHALTPDLAQSVDQSSSTLFGALLALSFMSLPVGILFLALSAGLGEEMLFRGAVQPRLGLLLTALLFTAFHDQYGFSFELLGIFAIALALGWLRANMNLWAAIAAHSWYDFLASFGFSLPVLLILGTLGLAICLVLLHSHSARLFPPPPLPSSPWQQI